MRRRTSVCRPSMVISPRITLCSGAVPSNAKPLCFRTTPVKQMVSYARRAARRRCTFAAIGADEPAITLCFDLHVSAYALLDGSLDAVLVLLEPDQLGGRFHEAAVFLEMRTEDGFRMVLCYLIRVVLFTGKSRYGVVRACDVQKASWACLPQRDSNLWFPAPRCRQEACRRRQA